MLNLLKMLKLQNVYLKHGSMQNRLAYKKRRNYCVTSLKKKNVDHFNNQEINFEITKCSGRPFLLIL